MIEFEFTWWGSPNRLVEKQLEDNVDKVASIIKRDGTKNQNGDYVLNKQFGGYMALMSYDEQHKLISVEFRPGRF